MHGQSNNQASKTPAEVKAELLAHLESEHSTAQAQVEKNEREGFPDAAASWLPAVAKWKRMIDFVQKIQPEDI